MPLYVLAKSRWTREQIKGLIISLSVVALLLVIQLTARSSTLQQKAAPCTLTVETSPVVRELKLGQPYEQFQRSKDYRIIGGQDADDNNLRRVYLVNYLGQSERLQGIDRITLLYLDDKLASIEIRYSPDVKWESDLHFASAIASQLGLPTTSWVNKHQPTLNCEGFFVEAGAMIGGQLKLESSNLQAELRKRRTVLEQKRRVEFKP